MESFKEFITEVRHPDKWIKGYKLFRVDKKAPGKIFPLYVDAKISIPLKQWVDAKTGERTIAGKVKSKIGDLAYRPGWHSADYPVATHIGYGGKPPKYRGERGDRYDQVWAEVRIPADVNWQDIVNKNAKRNKQGEIVPKTAQVPHIPVGGYYKYKTNPNMTGFWYISGMIQIVRVLSYDEVERINKKVGMKDLPREYPFNAKDFGF